MTIPEIETKAAALAVNAHNSEVQELAALVAELAKQTHESLEFLAKTKLDDAGGDGATPKGSKS